MSRAYGDTRKEKRKKKKKPTVELVQYQKPEVYELVEAAEEGHKHGHKLGGHFGGHLGGHGGHLHGGHGGGLHFKKKHGRSIGGLFWAVWSIRYSFWLWFYTHTHVKQCDEKY